MNKLRYTILLLALLLNGGWALSQTPTVNGGVFGGGRMANVGTDGAEGTTATVVINNSKVTAVYGGNDITGKVRKGTVASASVTVNNGTVGKVYGGGNGRYDYVEDTNKTTITVKDKDSETVVATFAHTADSIPQIEITSVEIVNTSMSSMEQTLDNVSNLSNWNEAGTSWGISEVFGGGNNADVSTSTKVTVNGGMVKYVFGGNNLAAMQTAVPDVFIKHGLIHSVYGGGNAGRMKGVIAGTIDYSKFISQQSLPQGIYNSILPFFTGTDVMIDDTDTENTNTLLIGNVYGGCRAANVDNSTYVRVTRANGIGNVFGGCDIAGSVGTYPGTLTTDQTFTTYKDGDPHAAVTVPETTTTYSIGPSSEAIYKTSDMIYASTYVLMNGATVKNIYGGGNGNYTYVNNGNTIKVYPVGAEQSDANLITSYNNLTTNKPFVTSSRLSVEGGTVTNNVYGGGNAAEVGHVFDKSDPTRAQTYQVYHLQDNKYKYYGKELDSKLTRTSYLFLGKTDRSSAIPVIQGNVYGGGCMANIYGTMDVIVKSDMTINNLFAGNDASGKIDGEGRGSNQEHVTGTDELIGSMLFDPARNESGTKPWQSYSGADLNSSNAGSYIRVEPGATITNLYGGGNGDYTYTKGDAEVTIKQGETIIGIVEGTFTEAEDAKPTMAGTWVDMKGNATNFYGGGNAANVGYANAYITGDAVITNAFGGGNAATVTGNATITVDCNAATAESNYNVQNLYGGNNIAAMYIVPSMNIKRGKIGNVYGGGNAGDMKGVDAETVDFSEFLAQEPLPDGVYNTITPLWTGTDIMIDSNYEKDANGTPTGKSCGLRVDNVYGGCRAANVDNSTYIRLTHADYIGNVYGGCDIAGSVGMSPGKLTAPQTFSTYVPGKSDFEPVKDPTDSSKDYTYGKKGDDMLYSSSYILMTGGTVNGSVYGSGNGNYRYEENTADKLTYVYDLKLGDALASFKTDNLSRPYVASATVSIEGGTINGNVYGGGYNAELGHVITQVDLNMADANHKSGDKLIHYGKEYAVGDILSRTCYIYIGKTDRTQYKVGSTTEKVDINLTQSVFGGGCLANVYGVMDIIVKQGAVINNLYAGNDVSGNVYGKNRGSVQQLKTGLTDHIGTMLIDNEATTYTKHHYDSYTGQELNESNAGTYIRIENGATITNLYGGGNGDYTYSATSGGQVNIYKGSSDLIGTVTAASVEEARPVQGVSFLDVAGTVTNLYGGGNAADVEVSNVCVVRDAKVQTAFGGGNSATVTKNANIWIDCNAATENATSDNYNVWTMFGGNNLAEMKILPTIYLQCGQVGTVYGGGNAGKMSGHDAFALDFSAYKDNDCLKEDVVKTATVNNKQKTYLPMFSATEVLVDSPYKLNGTTKEKLPADPTADDYAKDCGLRINTVYGGCKAADVDNSTYTRITRADYIGNVYAGNDIAGTVGMNPGTVDKETELVAYEVLTGETDATRFQTGVKFAAGTKMVNSGSYVFITGGKIDGSLFGGGNGDYTYTLNGASYSNDGTNVTLTSDMKKPISSASFVGVEGGTITGNVYGGGNKVDVGGVAEDYDKASNPFYDCAHLFIGETDRKKSEIQIASAFGGGNSAGIKRNTHTFVDGGTITGTLYGGCNSEGTVGQDSKVVVMKGTIGTEGATKKVTENSQEVTYLADAIFGGGLGSATSVAHNVYVTVISASPVIYGNIYGGGNAGPVNTDCEDVTQTTVAGGAIYGDVFGGGFGANVNGKINLTIKDPANLNAVTDTDYGNHVFATNNSSGEVACGATLNFESNSCGISIYGGGNKAKFYGNTNVVFTKGKVGYIYGGGNEADVLPKAGASNSGNTNVYILGGEVCYDVFGGGKNGNVAGNSNVCILDDRLTSDGQYVVDKKDDGTLILGTSGDILIDPTTNLPYKPTSVSQSSIKIGGDVYGGGQKGYVGGKANVHVGE